MNATDVLPTLTLAGAVLVIVVLGGIRNWIVARYRARRARRRARLAPRHRRRRGGDEELRKAIRRWVRS
jgi:hypothetical protein